MRRIPVLTAALALSAFGAGIVGASDLTRGTATRAETVLHSFGGPDGAAPLTGVISDANGALYGTTVFGGVKGIGTVFKLTPGPSGYTESVLHNFRGPDGDRPDGLVGDGRGGFYGTTFTGGTAGQGTVFKLTPAGSGYKESLLYSFTGRADGGQPLGNPVLDKTGAIYGVTQIGGAANYGAVFKLTPAGSTYVESVLYAFPGGAGGYLPQAGLTIDSGGSLYGSTYYGGYSGGPYCSGGCGLIFRLTPSRSVYAESVLYAFKGGADGENPSAAPTVDDVTGTVYGTTDYGGRGSRFYDAGTVFELVRTGSGYRETRLRTFGGKLGGDHPMSQLLLASDRTLYGTVAFGGRGCGCGFVYELKPAMSGFDFRVLFEFSNANSGADPEYTTLILDKQGLLYGTTRSGGSQRQCGDGGPATGCGVVFRLAP